MTDTTDRRTRRGHDELTARRYNGLLKAENLSLRSRQDPGSVAKEAAAHAAERRYAWETRRRPGYVSAEAQQPFQPERRLIRRVSGTPATRTGTAGASAPRPKPSFAEMREQRDAFPVTPREVQKLKQRKREERRAVERRKK